MSDKVKNFLIVDGAKSFDHTKTYEEAIAPIMKQLDVIMKEVGMNGFTMFEVKHDGELMNFEMQGQDWTENFESSSFARYICKRVTCDVKFAERLRNIMHILDAEDSKILGQMMGVADKKILLN